MSSTKYGMLIDDEFPIRQETYRLLSQYFENPELTKVKNIDQYSMYAVEIHAMLLTEKRYLIVFVNGNTYPTGHKRKLSDCSWISLQTRTLTENYNVGRHVYQPRRFIPLYHEISLTHSDSRGYVYKCPKLDLNIILLPTRKDTQAEYLPTGNLIKALETFQTIVSW